MLKFYAGVYVSFKGNLMELANLSVASEQLYRLSSGQIAKKIVRLC